MMKVRKKKLNNLTLYFVYVRIRATLYSRSFFNDILSYEIEQLSNQSITGNPKKMDIWKKSSTSNLADDIFDWKSAVLLNDWEYYLLYIQT